MRRWLLGICAIGILWAQGNPRELVRESIRNGARSWKESLGYYCVKRDVDRQYDITGRVKSTSDDVYDVIPLGDGTSFDQLVERDGEPIPVEERLKVEKELQRRRAETPAQKRRRFEKELADRSYMEEVPDAFDFQITGEENLPTGPAWVLKATPHPGYEPKSRYAHMFSKMHGTLWIDQRDKQWVKADAVAAEAVTFGYFIARLAKGSHIILEQMKLPDGTWVPKRITARAEARTFLVFNHNFEEDISYDRYRKATALAAAR